MVGFFWGFNFSGQLYNRDPQNDWLPVQVIGLPEDVPVMQLYFGENRCIFVLADSRVFALGHNGWDSLVMVTTGLRL